ncbi:Tm-1-like ATP-binding domain-containing protein [Tetragenococcus halophilus]|nr:Tm-1-like ATP-binding domain-containing protein [Tetragenococcus halophilus]
MVVIKLTKTIAVIGTLDTKPREFQFVKDVIESLGFDTFVIHSGVFEPGFVPDVSNQEIVNKVDEDIKVIAAQENRAKGTATLAEGMSKLLPELFKKGKFNGVISLGGSGGTSVATAGMRVLPIGVPKVMVSTMASGDTSQYVGTSDIVMMPSIVDVAGLNDISKRIFSNAVHAICGMVDYEYEPNKDQKPLIAATMFGLTTPAIVKATEVLENKNYEVIVFHATGIGGKTMERLINNGYFAGVLDLTTTEWADELVGGVLAGGNERLDAAVQTKTPQVVSLGALDMVNFGPHETVPDKFKDRLFYQHNPSVTLMRTTTDENHKLGKIIANKLQSAGSSTVLMIPRKGFSGLDKVGKEFYNKKADESIISTLKENLTYSETQVIEKDNNINDETFAEEAANQLIHLIKNKEENDG